MASWYVIQVKAGSEAGTKEGIEKFVDSSAYSEVFFPQRLIRKNYRGVWKDCLETLFPGYLFVVSSDAQQLADQLRAVPAFTRLLGNKVAFGCLSASEVALLQAFQLGPAPESPKLSREGCHSGTPRRNYVLGMSQGIKEGNEVRIIKGPLMDNMAYVKRIDRHKRLAYVEFEICGRKVVTKMGLELLMKHGG